MSQRTALQAMDSAVFGAFSDAGFADAATYSAPPSGAAQACTVLVDRPPAVFGDDELPVYTRQVLVTFQRAQVRPVVGGTVAIGADTFELWRVLREDESMAQWVCAPRSAGATP
jgi:hypothetical protein